MSDNNIFIDDDDKEEIYIPLENNIEEVQEVQENQIIIPEENSIVEILLNTSSFTNSSVNSRRRIRKRNEVETTYPNKIFRNSLGKRIIRKRIPNYLYLKLKSGDEFNFKEEDGKNILLNEIIEPNRLIRNIVSNIPTTIVDRLEYLAKFISDDETDDTEDSNENNNKIKRRYFSNLKDLVYEAYIKEWRLRFLFKRVLVLWRIYRMNKSNEKEIDPITLSEPEKEVYIYDWVNKKKFTFDAKSLAIMIESQLMYHEYGFSMPIYPRNPKNNVNFSYKQMISLYNQFKIYGELKWGFTTLREYNFNKKRWESYHKSALTMNAIKTNISQLDNFEGRDMLLDFIFAKMDELKFIYTTNTYNYYIWAMINIPNHWYLEKLKTIFVLHYEVEHFGQNKDRIINLYILRILKKQNIFLSELKNKIIIN